ncbi:MAG: carbohydrate kinase family protein [Anaerolineae bacterium]|jgi:sugar/nucleoside kinase (ribokinase family)|nr:sugar kinase [Chloroflexota bacterium]
MSDRPYDLLVVGELNADILVGADAVPVFGQFEKIVDQVVVTGGGSAGIFAAAASRLGLNVLYASVVGDDLFGHMLLDVMREAGVDVRHVVVDPKVSTGVTVHLLTPDGDRAMLTDLGSITAITSRVIDPAWYSSVRHLHLVSPFLLSGLRPAMPDMIAQAHRQGVTVSLDTNWDPAERWDVADLISEVDLLMPNEAELCALTGHDEVDEALIEMCTRVPVVALKRGSRGATGAQGNERVITPAFQVKTVDGTGAGDTFDAGFLAAWLRGATLQQALVAGAAAGALNTISRGGFGDHLSWQAVLALVEAQSPALYGSLAVLGPVR